MSFDSDYFKSLQNRSKPGRQRIAERKQRRIDELNKKARIKARTDARLKREEERVTALEDSTNIIGGEELEGDDLRDQAQDMQLRELQSLPPISNAGSSSFQGNISVVPGGFQPLPLTSGQSKKLYQLSQFNGGINQKSSPRDISDAECQEAINVSFSDSGSIRLLGDIKSTDNSVTVHACTSDRCSAGYGLFQFTAPANISGSAGETVITLSGDGDDIDATDGSTTNDAWITFGGDDNSNVAPTFYSAGLGVYVNDAYFSNTSNNPRAKIYVYREDANGTVSGWVDGTPLIDSPLSDNEDTAVANKVNISASDEAASNNGSLNVNIVPENTGTWDGEYFFYVSWLFDGGVETGLTAIGTDTFSKNTLRLNPSLVHTTSNPLGGNKRIEGARIYFKEAGTTERWLLAELSLQDGVKGALDSTFVPWTIGSNVHDLDNSLRLVFDAPPAVINYLALNQYDANEVYTVSSDLNQDDQSSGNAITGPTPHSVRYKTAVVGQRGIVYIGNVKFQGKHKPDTMMFSVANKPGVFPRDNFIDSPSSDGSPITALASYGDKILQFKVNGLYIFNVSNGGAGAFVEDGYRDCGVYNQCQVFNTSFGVVFANQFGCFLYNGEQVVSLTAGKLSDTDWDLPSDEGFAAGNQSVGVPCVGYDPRSNNIIVLKDINDDATSDSDGIGDEAWIYNMDTNSWSEGTMITNVDANRHTNFIISEKGYLSILRDNSTSLFNFNQGQASGNAQTITYITKDIDFGFPSQTKKIFKIYVTYKGDANSLTGTYGANGDTSPDTAMTNSETSDGTFQNAGTGDHNVATFTLSSQPSDLKSIMLKFTGSCGEDFEINDISILYRVRPIK